MFEKTTRTEKLSRSALVPLGDEALAQVSGAHKHHHHHHHDHGGGGGGLLASLLAAQTNVAGPIIQIAIGNTGNVTQIASISQSNALAA